MAGCKWKPSSGMFVVSDRISAARLSLHFLPTVEFSALESYRPRDSHTTSISGSCKCSIQALYCRDTCRSTPSGRLARTWDGTVSGTNVGISLSRPVINGYVIRGYWLSQ